MFNRGNRVASPITVCTDRRGQVTFQSGKNRSRQVSGLKCRATGIRFPQRETCIHNQQFAIRQMQDEQCAPFFNPLCWAQSTLWEVIQSNSQHVETTLQLSLT